MVIPTSILGKLDPKPAAARSIALLQQGSGSFFKEGGCGSCHDQNLTSMAVNAAFANRIPVNTEAKAAELKGVQLAFAGFVQPLLQRGDPPVVDILLYAGFQMASENVVPDQTTDAMVHNLWRSSARAATGTRAGWRARRWATAISRAPRWRFAFCRCMVPAGRKAELQQRIQRAARWLATATPKTTEDLNMQLLGLKWAGAVRRGTDAGVRRLMQSQREDGGWAQTAGPGERCVCYRVRRCTRCTNSAYR